MDDIERQVTDLLSSFKSFDSKSKWTVIASIFLSVSESEKLRLVALGTGNKCLSHENASAHPEALVHDSHAEIICRRAFISFLFAQLTALKQQNLKSNDFIQFSAHLNRWELLPGTRLIFYTSHSPCGDASMHQFNNEDVDGINNNKRLKTGTKLIEGREESHLLGVLRTKPGRIDSPITKSLSCSDKISCWNIIGVQGALLSHLFTPVYIDTIVIGNAFDRESCERALKSRTESIIVPENLIKCGFKNNSTNLKISSTNSSSYSQSPQDSRQDASLFWYNGLDKPGFIVQGFKKGSKVPRRGEKYPLSLQSQLSREYIFEKLFKPNMPDAFSSCRDAKIGAESYQLAKAILFDSEPFSSWPVSDEKMKEFRDNLLSANKDSSKEA